MASRTAFSKEQELNPDALDVWESEGGHTHGVRLDRGHTRGRHGTTGSAVTAASKLAEAERDSRAACMVCGHPVVAHDPIAVRYCDATLAHAFTRRCICQGV